MFGPALSPPSPKSRSAASLILRGANGGRNGALSARRPLCGETSAGIPPGGAGGGGVETALSVYLDNFARTLVGGVVGLVGGAGRLDFIFVPTFALKIG